MKPILWGMCWKFPKCAGAGRIMKNLPAHVKNMGIWECFLHFFISTCTFWNSFYTSFLSQFFLYYTHFKILPAHFWMCRNHGFQHFFASCAGSLAVKWHGFLPTLEKQVNERMFSTIIIITVKLNEEHRGDAEVGSMPTLAHLCVTHP